MSRSIHTTWASLKKEQKKQNAKKVKGNPEKLDKMYDDLTKKRQIKRQIIHQRTLDSLYVSTAPDSIPIHIYDESEFVHYPITEKDIREILTRLPQGIVDGLKCIELRLGAGHEKKYDDLPEPDPYTGRPGFEILPKVFQPKVLGIYSSREKVIKLCAYVYKSIPDFEMWNVCLKIYMLMTLSHELYHHFDFQYRMGRGRWLNNSVERIEGYAEDMECKWLEDVIVPYIEETYKEEITNLNEWIVRKIGIKLPLSILAGDPRKYSRKSSVKSFFSTDESFCEFVKGVYNGEDLNDLRVSLATGFHYAEIYDISLDIIETVLNKDSQNIKALILKADTYVHQGKYKEAEQFLNEVLEINKNEFKAWSVLCDINFHKSEWQRLLDVTMKAIELIPDGYSPNRIVLYQVKALIETGELTKAEELLNKLPDTKMKNVVRKINELREEIMKKKQVNN